MSTNSEPGQSPTALIILDSVLDCMTTLAVDSDRLGKLIFAGNGSRNGQRQAKLASELSALALTLAEANRRLQRCLELSHEDD